MIVTTTDLKQDYEIKGIVRFYLNARITKLQLGKEMPTNEAIDYVIDSILSKQAEEMEADAIVGLAIDSSPAPGMSGTSTYYIFYGTAVKIK